MAGTKRRPRTLIIAAIIVAVSATLVVTGIPQVPSTPQQAGTIDLPVTRVIAGGTPSNPSNFGFVLPNVVTSRPFSLIVSSNATASFCVMVDSSYQSWHNTSPSSPFPWDGCLVQRKAIIRETLTFSVPFQGNWDVVALNSNPTAIKVQFLPATS